jgi:cysteine synthase A
VRNVRRRREQGILLPTFARMMDLSTAPAAVRQGLRCVGMWDVNPLNLFRSLGFSV